MVRKYFYEKGRPHKNRMIVIEGAFHGRTLGAISATTQEKMVKGFGPLLDGFDPVAFGNLNELRAAITPATAAIHVEPIMGEGGIKVASVEYLQALRAIADEFDLLLYFDEIQCGMGRTGKLFAHEWAGVTPDIVCIAKAIGNGFPLGACLATAEAASGMTAGYHGSTYGGNPLAMAVGNAVLDVMLAPEFLPQVEATGARLRARLETLVETHPGVFEELRGKGLMLGLKLTPAHDPTAFINEALREGLLVVRASDNVVRLLPPLVIGDAEIDEALSLLERVAAKLTVPELV
jgi:acetylornithine/N-succinyldiaminopimelate aminotransferase